MMLDAQRRRLPNRRPGETHTLHVGNHIRCPCTPVGIGAILALDPGMALGYTPETQDEADALAILHHVNGGS